MQQKLLKIGVGRDAKFYASDFREMLAKQSGIPHQLFHREEGGATAQGMPGVRFIGGAGWVGILADEPYQALLYDVMGGAVQAVQQRVGRNVPITLEDHTFCVEPKAWAHTYWVRDLAIKTRTIRRKALLEDNPSELVRLALLEGIERQARAAGIDLPLQEQLELTVLDVSKLIRLRLRTSAGDTDEFLPLTNAQFSLFAEIKGFCFAGNLTSRGYGRIGRDLNGLAVNAQREDKVPRKVIG